MSIETPEFPSLRRVLGKLNHWRDIVVDSLNYPTSPSHVIDELKQIAENVEQRTPMVRPLRAEKSILTLRVAKDSRFTIRPFQQPARRRPTICLLER